MPSIPYLTGTSHLLTLSWLRTSTTPGYLNAATVEVTLTDAATGDAIVGQPWPLTMAYVTGSNGVYRATLPYDLVVDLGQRLKVVVVYNAGSGVGRTWHLDLVVVDG